jgi:hypothetical protein
LRFPSEIEAPLIGQTDSQTVTQIVIESIKNPHKKLTIFCLKQEG